MIWLKMYLDDEEFELEYERGKLIGRGSQIDQLKIDGKLSEVAHKLDESKGTNKLRSQSKKSKSVEPEKAAKRIKK